MNVFDYNLTKDFCIQDMQNSNSAFASEGKRIYQLYINIVILDFNIYDYFL